MAQYFLRKLRVHIFDGLAAIVLLVFLLLSWQTMLRESATTDEAAHIPAAYSYVLQGDYTLNPEHPPLAKLISGLGFIGSHYSFPTQLLHGTNKVSDREWQAGRIFLYHSGNDTDAILFRSRLPILLATTAGLLACYLLFAAVSSKKIALIALAFMALSPTVIGHSHLVTTDALSMVTIAIAILCFARYLQKPSRWYGAVAGISLAIAELTKFSAAILFLLYVLAAAVFFWAQQEKFSAGRILKTTAKSLLPVFIVATALIYIAYIPHVMYLSAAAQNDWILHAVAHPAHSFDVRALLEANKFFPAAPLVRFFIGFTNDVGRVAIGGGANLLGHDYLYGTPLYFPVVSVLKTPSPMLGLWLLMAVWLGYVIKTQRKRGANLQKQLRHFVASQPVVMCGVLFSVLYFLIACAGKLDIGIRHLLPMFPWLSFLSALWIVRVLQAQRFRGFPIGTSAFAGLMAAYIFIAVSIFPNYLPYTTEVVGGSSQAYRYYNDSNVDWGQAIKYLAIYAHGHPAVLPLYTDDQYADAKNYYFCRPAPSCAKLLYIQDDQKPPPGSYIAISEVQLTIEWGRSKSTLAYLKNKTPLYKVGDAIYIYHIQ